jgi:site-specific DNA-methyltransferase (adenine-specific)
LKELFNKKVVNNCALYLGDCLEVMKIIPDKSIDMILCDLPYGITACKWDVIIPFEPLWEQYKRIIKDKGCIALFGSEPFSSYLRMSNIKGFKYDWIWEKGQGSSFTSCNIAPLKSHEIISIFGEKRLNYYPIMINKKNIINTTNWKQNKRNSELGHYSYKNNSNTQRIYSKSFPLSVINYSRSNLECNNTKRLHPTQKPVLLLQYLIKTYTKENETVLDNCMGSGSTGVACHYLNRKFIGIEKDEKYFDIACKRIQNPEQNPKPISKAGNIFAE